MGHVLKRVFLCASLLAAHQAEASPVVSLSSAPCVQPAGPSRSGSALLVKDQGRIFLVTASDVVFHGTATDGVCHHATIDGASYDADFLGASLVRDLALLELKEAVPPAVEQDAVDLTSMQDPISAFDDLVLLSGADPSTASTPSSALQHVEGLFITAKSARAALPSTPLGEVEAPSRPSFRGGAVTDANGRIYGLISSYVLNIGPGRPAQFVEHRQPLQLAGGMVALYIPVELVYQWISRVLAGDPLLLLNEPLLAQYGGHHAAMLDGLSFTEVDCPNSAVAYTNRSGGPIGGGQGVGIGGVLAEQKPFECLISVAKDATAPVRQGLAPTTSLTQLTATAAAAPLVVEDFQTSSNQLLRISGLLDVFQWLNADDTAQVTPANAWRAWGAETFVSGAPAIGLIASDRLRRVKQINLNYSSGCPLGVEVAAIGRATLDAPIDILPIPDGASSCTPDPRSNPPSTNCSGTLGQTAASVYLESVYVRAPAALLQSCRISVSTL